MAFYLVRYGRGPAYDPTRPRRDQDGWNEHAAFMDRLVERGTVLLGGPIGDNVDRGDALLIVSADDERAARATLTSDPWHGTTLEINSLEPWWLWLRSPALTDLLP